MEMAMRVVWTKPLPTPEALKQNPSTDPVQQKGDKTHSAEQGGDQGKYVYRQ